MVLFELKSNQDLLKDENLKKIKIKISFRQNM